MMFVLADLLCRQLKLNLPFEEKKNDRSLKKKKNVFNERKELMQEKKRREIKSSIPGNKYLK